MARVQLGDKVKDPVSGFTGIAVGVTTWMYGCDRIIVQPEGISKEGKQFENASFDEPQLVVLQKQKIKVKKDSEGETGGPRPEVRDKGSVSRF